MASMNRSRTKNSQKDEPEELPEQMISDAVKCVLVLDRTKKAFRQSEVLNAINGKIPRKRNREFFEKVKLKLREIGLFLHLDGCGSPTIFLSSAEKPPLFMSKFATQEEKADRTLIVLVLSYIFMKEDIVTEDEIFKKLSRLQIITEVSSYHNYFGDVKKKIQCQFVEEMYLKRVVSECGQVELQWGARADVEFSKSDALNFVCNVAYGGERNPSDFAAQNKRATEELSNENEGENDE